ncbi:MAG: hypothetical protein ABEJ05_13495, partial [Haloglomus sp.]
MTRRTRRSVLAALGVGLATAGCLSDAGTGTGDETTANETTDRPAGETPVRETTDGWVSQASNSPEPDHEVSVRSEAST